MQQQIPFGVSLLVIFVIIGLTVSELGVWRKLRELGTQLLGENAWKLVEHPFTGTGIATVVTATWLVLDYPKWSPTYKLGVVLFCVSWLCFSVSIHRSGLITSRAKKWLSLVALGVMLYMLYFGLPKRAAPFGSPMVKSQPPQPGSVPTPKLPPTSPLKSPPPKPSPPIVPEVSLMTQMGLALTDFPDLTVSPEMAEHIRRQTLTITNNNLFTVDNLTIRFQLPEPVIGRPVVDQQPAGTVISWNACRVSFSFSSTGGASATPLQGGGTQLSTGAKAGSAAVLSGAREVCSAAMNNANLEPIGVYQLQIERLPAQSTVRLGVLTSNDPSAAGYIEFTQSDESRGSLMFYGDGIYQFSTEGRTKTLPIFIELKFDRNSRTVSSLPSSGERGKWKISVIHLS